MGPETRQPAATGAPSLVKRALAEIRELRAKLERADRDSREPIAVVGLGCRFPGAANPDAFWTLLREGRSAIREVPADRWDVDAFFDSDPDAPGKMYTRWGGFLEDVDRFDARFFGITPREAAAMDPQQRLLLEVAWESLEHAGIPPDRLRGAPVGVFVGLAASDYLQLQLRGLAPEDIDAYVASGSSAAVASGRLSYFLGVNGPSLTVDTACSSSLVAVHLACQSLRARECGTALAGGASLILLPELNINFSRARMMAADGRCKAFAAAADGYVRSEGCGLVVLKRLVDAVADNDRILAVIRGSAVNQDGRSSGLTVPNGPAQEAVLREALTRSGVKPADVAYVEAHGTGTPLGDPIEARALAAVFRQGRPADRPLVVASAKTNVGHLEAAAGIAGLIKVVLALGQAWIPPHLHLDAPNPLIEWDDLPVTIPTTGAQWPAGYDGRIAGVSSFGFSGTNAHVILEAAPVQQAPAPSRPDRPRHVLPISARTPAALRVLAAEMAARLERTDDSIADVCFTAAAGRTHFAHRAAITCDSVADARDALAAFAAGRPSRAAHGVHEGAATPVAFVFAGYGTPDASAARTLYDALPPFAAAIERCDTILRDRHHTELLPTLFDAEEGGMRAEPRWTLPALFAFEYALAAVWRSWGLTPSFVLGHGVGEYVAACIAGVMDLEDALRLVAVRADLMQRAAQGRERVEVCAGENLVRDFLAPLPPAMLGAYAAPADRASYREPDFPFISTLTGELVSAAAGSVAYWRQLAGEPAPVGSAVQTARDGGCRTFLEIGPVATLLGSRDEDRPEDGRWLPSLNGGGNPWRQMLDSLAALYADGVAVDWESFDRHYPRRRVALPTYPFERERFWRGSLSPAGRRPAARRDAQSAWAEVTLAAGAQATQAPLDLVLTGYPVKWQRLDEIALAYVVQSLRAAALFGRAGEAHTAADVAARLGAQPQFAGLVRRWLQTLAQQGLLTAGEQDGFAAAAPLPDVVPAALAADARELFDDFPAPLAYVRRCGEHLGDLVSGRESGLEMLFPDGSPEIADGLYNTSPLSRYSNAIVLAAVTAGASALALERQPRILEIGAGTGGTTAALLPHLARTGAAYCFTDVGPLFLAKARERFSAFPFVTYRTLDIERVPSEQGFRPHEFDVVVASNVLHATRNLHETLDHVAWLLAPGGLLVLCEATVHPFWFDTTTAFIGGWRRFDDDLREDVPLLAPDAWVRALGQHAFDEARAYPEPGSPAEVLRQHVFVARRGAAADAASSRTLQADDSPGVASPASVTAALPLRSLADLPVSERHERLVAFIRDTVAQVVGAVAAPPARDQRLMDFGVDSLMALELRNVLSTGLGLSRKLPATLIYDHPTIDAIARFVDGAAAASQVDPAPRPQAEPAPRAVPSAAISAETLAEMSDEEAAALLDARLRTL